MPKKDGNMAEFKYYFAQREAIETIIYLYEVAKVKDKYDLIRYDSSGAVSTGMFDEEWLRLMVKMATGSGKTKVMSMIITWCYFHKLYEDDSNKKKINELTIQDKGIAEIRDYIKLKQTRPYVVKDQGFIIPQKSLFNKIIGDSHLELLFASFLEKYSKEQQILLKKKTILTMG